MYNKSLLLFPYMLKLDKKHYGRRITRHLHNKKINKQTNPQQCHSQVAYLEHCCVMSCWAVCTWPCVPDIVITRSPLSSLSPSEKETVAPDACRTSRTRLPPFPIIAPQMSLGAVISITVCSCVNGLVE